MTRALASFPLLSLGLALALVTAPRTLAHAENYGDADLGTIFAVVLLDDLDADIAEKRHGGIQHVYDKFAAYQLPIAPGPIGYAPAFTKRSLAEAGGPATTYTPILGRFWSDDAATRAIEELIAHESAVMGIMEFTITHRPVHGAPGYAEIRIPLLESERERVGVAGEAVYIRDLERPGWEPRAWIYLGVDPDQSAAAFQWPVEVVTVDRARDRVVYCEGGTMKTREFTADPQPDEGIPLSNPEGTLKTVAAALGAGADTLVVMSSNGVARAYQFTGGQVVAKNLTHKGKVWQVNGTLWSDGATAAAFNDRGEFTYRVTPDLAPDDAPFL